MARDIKSLIDAVMLGDVPADAGSHIHHASIESGPAKFGITPSALSRFLQRTVEPGEMEALDIRTAREIYMRRYYLEPGINQLPEAIQPFVFDSAIIHGPRRAIRFVQQVCNDADLGPLSCNGLMDHATQAAATACHAQAADWMMRVLVRERRLFYRNIAASDHSQQVFLEGWLARLDGFLPNGSCMSAAAQPGWTALQPPG